MFELLKKGKPLCAMDVVEKLGISRYAASNHLSRLGKLDNVTAKYIQEIRGKIMYSIKYYQLKK